MIERESQMPWEEVDEADFLYSGTHYALYGPELMSWQLYATEWAFEVFARDKRDVKAVLRFIPVFLANLETGKRLPDGRQFSLLSQDKIVKDIGCSKATAKSMIERVTLTRRYAYLRDRHSPVVEIVQATLEGARSGRWGTGYAPILPAGAMRGPGAESERETVPGASAPPVPYRQTGTASLRETDLGPCAPEMDSDEAGTISQLAGTITREAGTSFPPTGTVTRDAGTVTRDAGTAFRPSGTVSLEEAVPSYPSIQSSSSSSPSVADPPGYGDFLAVFPIRFEDKAQETREAYEACLRSGYSAGQLIDGARRQLREAPVNQRSRYALHFLAGMKEVKRWCGHQPEQFDEKKMVPVAGGGWLYVFSAKDVEPVDCPAGSSREDAIRAAGEMLERKQRQGLI